MDVYKTIEKYYKPDSKIYHILVEHGKAVAEKAKEIADNLGRDDIDYDFLYEASMLHDIGVFETNAPKIECFGDNSYIQHGVLGREILENERLPKHALVCERHVGVGLTVEDIERENFPLPKREMLPESIEEKIICIADKFFSKSGNLHKEADIKDIRREIAGYGSDNLKRFDTICRELKIAFK